MHEICQKSEPFGPVVEVPEAKQLFDALSKSGNSHQMAVVPWFLNLFGCFEDVDMGFQGQGVQWNALFYRNPHQEMAELPYLVIFKNPHSILRGTRVIITYLSKPNPYLLYWAQVYQFVARSTASFCFNSPYSCTGTCLPHGLLMFTLCNTSFSSPSSALGLPLHFLSETTRDYPVDSVLHICFALL